MLGGLVVEGIAERELGSRKGRTLAKVLALARGAPVPVERLVDVLWGDQLPARPAEQVGVLVSRLRAVVGAHRLPRSDAGYALLVDWLDVDELSRRTEEAARALAAGRVSAARAAAGAAVTLARGPLLPDEDGDWVVVERVSVQAEVARARIVAMEAAAAAGDHAAAATLAQSALSHDPYDEVALRGLMRAHAAAGRPASALAAYVRARERLTEDLGVSPSGETEALHDEILLADADAAARPPSPGAGVSLPGRAAQLAALDAALARAVGGAAVTVVVEGEAGFGKSTLVERWSEGVGPDVLLLTGHCDELGRDLPLQPLADAVSAQLRSVEPARVAEVIDADGTVLGDLLGLPLTAAGPTAATVVPDLPSSRARLFGALLRVVERLADGRPVALVVEDLHRAGALTVSWLAHAQRRGRRLMIVATLRPGGPPPLARAEVVRLGPLDEADARLIVGPERAADLHARSGGHPLFLSALASADTDDLPATVAGVIDRQCAELGPALPTVRAAAVLGDDIDLDLLAGVLATSAIGVLADLEAAAGVGLVVERGDGFSFRHALVRESLVAGQGSARRSLVHREAARVLAARPGHEPLGVAVHAAAGGAAELAAAAFVEAAASAFARFDVAAAESHLDAAIASVDSARARVARARVRIARQALDAAEHDAARAIDLGGGAEALEVAGWIAYYRRRSDRARVLAEEGLARTADPAVRTSCLALAGRARHGAGDLAGAIERLESTSGGPPEVRGVADVWLAQARIHEGRPGEALALVERALVGPGWLAHPWAPLHGRFVRVLALGQLGRVGDALVACDRLDDAVASAGEVGRRFVGPACNVRAWVLRGMGRLEEADERNRAAIDAVAASGRTRSGASMAEAHWVALLDLADGRLVAGDPEGAAHLADALAPLATWNGTMAWHQRHRLGLLRARLSLADGDREGAVEAAGSVATDAGRLGARRYRTLALAVAGIAGDGDVASLDLVVDALASCAGLEGWRLVAELGAARGVDRWRAEADRRAAALVRSAGPSADHTRRLVAAAHAGR